MTSVGTFGASGNGLNDDYGAFTGIIGNINTLEAAGRIYNGGRIDLDSNIYRTTNTIVTGSGFGMQIVGQGMITQSFDIIAPAGGPLLNPSYPFIGSVIMGDSLPSSVLDLRGVNHGLRDFSIWGRSGTAENRSAVGLQITKAAGKGTGKNRIYDIGIVDCTVGMKIGQSFSDGNCDLIVMDRAYITNCITGIQMVNSFALGNSFQHLYFVNCHCSLDFQAGGKTHMGQVGVDGTCSTFLVTNQQGYGNGQITFEDVFFDSTVSNIPQIVKSDGANDLTVKFGNIHIPVAVGSNSTDALFSLRNTNRVLVDSAQYLKGTIALFNGGGELRLKNCIFDQYPTGVTFVSSSSTGSYIFECIDCMDISGNPIDDFRLVAGVLTESGILTELDRATLTASATQTTASQVANVTTTTATDATTSTVGLYYSGKTTSRIIK